MPITILDLVLIGGDADLRPAGDGARLHARDSLDRGLGRRGAGHALRVRQAVADRPKTYLKNDTDRDAVVVVAGVFIGTLIVVSIITVRISDMILDSRIGALDRTLGFLFGLARGPIDLSWSFLFFIWLVPDKQRPDWVTGAKSRVVLQGTGEWLIVALAG